MEKIKIDGLTDLTLDEMSNENGGRFQAALALLGAYIYVYNEGGDFIDGFQEGFGG